MEPGTLAIMDDMRPVAQASALGGFFFLVGAAGLPAFLVWGDGYWVAIALLAFFLLLGGGLLLQMLPRFRRRNTPYLVLGPEGFRVPGLAGGPVPWAAVDHAGVMANYGAVTTRFVFKDGAALPERDGSRGNVRVRRGALFITGPSPRGMSLEEYGVAIAAGIEAGESEGEAVSRSP